MINTNDTMKDKEKPKKILINIINKYLNILDLTIL